MALPVSRDYTLTTASKVPPSLLNKLQDCVIGIKIPPTPIYIPHSAFAVVGGAPARSAPYTQFSSGTNSDMISAPLILPLGTRITEIRWHVAEGSMYCYAMRYPDVGSPNGTQVVVDGFACSLASVWVNLTSASVGVITPTSVLPHVTLADWSYVLEASGSLGALNGVRVTVDRL